MSQARTYEPALDGVRGLAILLVLGVHTQTKLLPSGFVGVTVFFCLSGYLITTLLAAEMDQRRDGRVDLVSFYRRRFARLYPALLLVIIVTVAVLVVGRRDLGTWGIAAPALAALGYVMNLILWSGGGFGGAGEFFDYTWTLAIEEQFYLLWPAALLLGYRRSPARFTLGVLAVVTALIVLDVALGLPTHARADHAYYGSDTNALPILAGAATALIIRGGWLKTAVRRLSMLAGVALAGLVVLARLNFTYHPSLATVAGTGCAVLVIAGVELRPAPLLRVVLTNRVAVWFGKRSYSLYLWNILGMIAIRNTLGRHTASDVVWLATVALAAELSYRFVEAPLRVRLGGSRSGGGLPAPGSATVSA